MYVVNLFGKPNKSIVAVLKNNLVSDVNARGTDDPLVDIAQIQAFEAWERGDTEEPTDVSVGYISPLPPPLLDPRLIHVSFAWASPPGGGGERTEGRRCPRYKILRGAFPGNK